MALREKELQILAIRSAFYAGGLVGGLLGGLAVALVFILARS